MHPRVPAALAVAWPGARWIVLEPRVYASRSRHLALAHERQHHRHLDPVFAWVWLFVRGALGWNPAVQAWCKLVHTIEEQAVDAAVVGRPDVSARAYGHLLLSTAAQGPVPAWASGLPSKSVGHTPSLLRSRLLMLSSPRSISSPPRLGCCVGFCGLAAGSRPRGRWLVRRPACVVAPGVGGPRVCQ